MDVRHVLLGECWMYVSQIRKCARVFPVFHKHSYLSTVFPNFLITAKPITRKHSELNKALSTAPPDGAGSIGSEGWWLCGEAQQGLQPYSI